MPTTSNKKPRPEEHTGEEGPDQTGGRPGAAREEVAPHSFTHISVLLEPIRRVLGERRQVGGIPTRFVAPRTESRASVSDAAPLVEETFTDLVTGRECSLQDMMAALMGKD